MKAGERVFLLAGHRSSRPMVRRMLGCVERLCFEFFPFCNLPFLCHSRVGGNTVFTKFTPAHGIYAMSVRIRKSGLSASAPVGRA